MQEFSKEKKVFEPKKVFFELPKCPDLFIFLLNSDPESLRSGSEKGTWIFHGVIGTTSNWKIRKSWTEKILPTLLRITRGGNFIDFQERNFFILWWENIGVPLLSFWMSVNREKVFLLPLDKKISLLLHKKDNWKESEIELFKWASVSHNFNLLKPTFLETINHFYNNQKRNREKELRFEVKFDHKFPGKESDIDIFISPLFEEDKNKKINIEVKRNPFPIIYRKSKKKETKMDAVQFLKDQINKEVEKYNSKISKNFQGYNRFQFVAEKLRNTKLEESILGIEIDEETKTSLSWVLRKVFMSDLIKSIADLISSVDKDKEIKEKKNEFEEQAFWVITPIPFSMKMKNNKDGKFITNKIVQKIYLQWFLLREIARNLKSPLNFFRFLIISFNELPMVNDGTLKDPSLVIYPRNISQEKQSIIWARSGEIMLDNLYIVISSSGELDRVDLEKKLKIYEKELVDLGYEAENIVLVDIVNLTPIFSV